MAAGYAGQTFGPAGNETVKVFICNVFMAAIGRHFYWYQPANRCMEMMHAKQNL
jgi:hypothetical protein